VTAFRGEFRALALLALALLAPVLLAGVALIAVPAQAADPPGPPVRLAPPQRLFPTAPPKSGEPAAEPGTPPGQGQDTSGIKVDPLAPIDPDWAGTLDEAQGALPSTLWHGTPRGFIAALLPRLPATTSPALQGLSRRLLLSSAAAPEGRDEPGQPSLFGRRIERLVALGQVEAAEAVLRAVSSRRDESIERQLVELKLLSNDREGACAAVDEGIKKNQGVWWDRALIACQSLHGEHAKAALGLSLLREQKAPRDDVFDALVEGLAGRSVKLPALQDPTPIQLALLRARKAPLPPDLARSDRPAVLRGLALDNDVPLALRLEAAERALAFGALPAERVRELYGKLDASAEDRANALTRGAAEKNARGRALLFEAARAQSVASARAELLRAFLEQSRDAGLYFAAVSLAEPLLLELRPTPELAWFAPDATRAFLALRRPAEAVSWLGTAEADAARALQPLVRIALGRGAPRWEPKALATFTEESAKRDGDAGPRQAILALGLLSALDEPVGAAEWTPLLGRAQPPTLGPQPAPVWLDLPRAAAAKRLGETVLLAVLLASDGTRLTPEPVILSRSVEALFAVGLDADARAIAVEAALAAGL
jgi:hypothetical protein